MQADIAPQTQSAPQVSQTPQSSYAAPVAPVAQSAAQAPAVGTTPQWVATNPAAVAPAPVAPAQMATSSNQGYAPTPSTYQEFQAPQQQDNPYKEAFNKVVGLLSSPVQFPFQGQQSTQTPAAGQANYGSQQTTQLANQAAPISTPGINSNQGYSNGSSQTSTELTAEQLRANGVSEASLQVIDHFGADAPAVLNDYACKIEDALVTTNGQLVEGVNLLKELNAEHKAYTKILTNPDILADYTTKFFGPKGPYPVARAQAAPQGRPVAQRQAPVSRAPQAAPRAQAAPAPSRPQMPAPPAPQAKGNPADFWNNFGNAADRNPENAWKYLTAAQQNPEIFRQKLLVME